MRKAVAAMVILVLLALGSLWNFRHLQRLESALSARIETSQALNAAGDTAGAEAELCQAVYEWRRADGYTHIFIRHAEIDAITDAFYDAVSELGGDGAQGAYGKLLARLSSMVDMERVTLKSVF